MKLSKKIQAHGETEKYVSVDGCFVPWGIWREWIERSEAYEERMRDTDERLENIRIVIEETRETTREINEMIDEWVSNDSSRPALGIQERTLAEAAVESEEQICSPLHRGYLFLARALSR